MYFAQEVVIMARHRFRDQIRNEVQQLPSATLSCKGFMVCPAAVQQLVVGGVSWQGAVYEMALAEARAVVLSSVVERFAVFSQN